MLIDLPKDLLIALVNPGDIQITSVHEEGAAYRFLKAIGGFNLHDFRREIDVYPK
jgi:hypothetical protein